MNRQIVPVEANLNRRNTVTVEANLRATEVQIMFFSLK